MKQLSEKLMKYLVSALALLGMAAGLVLIFSPLPLGLVVLALSLSLLINSNDAVTRRLADVRRAHHRFDTRLSRVEDKLARRVGFISNALIRTRPDLPAEAD
jgi:hypothetical protein